MIDDSMTPLLQKLLSRRSLLGIAALVFGGWIWSRIRPVAVDTIPVERRELIQSVVATGRVRSLSTARLGTAVSGTVRTVLVREGDRVRPGQVLLQLDEAEARAQVQQAEATLRQAAAGLAGVGEVRATVAAANLRSAEVAYRKAELDFQRAERLAAAGATSAEQVELANQTLAAARAQREIALAQRNATAGSGSELLGSEANQGQARAAVALARARLANTRIVAPGAGRLLTRDVEPGDAVQSGRIVLTLALDGTTQLVAVPDEKDVARLTEGQPATASAEAFPEQRFAARVVYVAPAIDPDQGTVEIRLDVDSAPSYLRPDMTVSVQVETARRPNALVVPVGVVRDLTTSAPWVMAIREGRVVRIPVTLGIRGEATVEVLGGLAEGDRVVAASARGVEPGIRARPKG